MAKSSNRDLENRMSTMDFALKDMLIRFLANTSYRLCYGDEDAQFAEYKREMTSLDRCEGYKMEYIGEKALEVQKKFSDLIKSNLERLIKKYGFMHPHVLVVGFEGSCGGCVTNKFVGVTSGAFLNYTPENSICHLGITTLFHELGHHKLATQYNCFNFDTPSEFKNLYVCTKELGITDSFKDSHFVQNPDSGHPKSNSCELYASAFMIVEAGFLEEYRKRFFPKFTEEQKQLAEKIFKFVQRTEVVR
ncbi:hypothetical protein HZA97_08460 [Candidatus Woesearchaeota archaeon]|nr:hypothetical protein [Candidatus Woesearchaeota archaeon]